MSILDDLEEILRQGVPGLEGPAPLTPEAQHRQGEMEA